MDLLASRSMFQLVVDWVPGSTLLDEKRKVRFDPPLYLQRYSLVMQTLEVTQWADEFHKVLDNVWVYAFPSLNPPLPIVQVVEFGCAEMSCTPILRRNNYVRHIVAVCICHKEFFFISRNIGLLKAWGFPREAQCTMEFVFFFVNWEVKKRSQECLTVKQTRWWNGICLRRRYASGAFGVVFLKGVIFIHTPTDTRTSCGQRVCDLMWESSWFTSLNLMFLYKFSTYKSYKNVYNLAKNQPTKSLKNDVNWTYRNREIAKRNSKSAWESYYTCKQSSKHVPIFEHVRSLLFLLVVIAIRNHLWSTLARFASKQLSAATLLYVWFRSVCLYGSGANKNITSGIKTSLKYILNITSGFSLYNISFPIRSIINVRHDLNVDLYLYLYLYKEQLFSLDVCSIYRSIANKIRCHWTNITFIICCQTAKKSELVFA